MFCSDQSNFLCAIKYKQNLLPLSLSLVAAAAAAAVVVVVVVVVFFTFYTLSK